jgi:flagellar hook-associated protein 1 FlgK
MGDLDNWASALIFEVNHLHSLGRGLDGLTTVTSSFGLEDPTASLADTTANGLEWAVTNGVFNINVTDSLGNTTTHQIKVDIGVNASDTTINDLAAAIDAVDNISASVNSANQLVIQADSTFTFGFSAPENAEDATNVLAALGINSFFAGSNAANIEIENSLISNPRGLAASANGLAGNGDVAGAIAILDTNGVGSLNGLSLTDAFSSLVSQIATDSKSAQDNYIAADVVVQTLEAERQSISGVSIDEEAINMIAFQRAFQGGARYVSVINEMLDEVVALVR